MSVIGAIYLEVDSEVDEDEDSLQTLAALVPVPSKSSISSTSAVSRLSNSRKRRSRDSEEDSADEDYYGVNDDDSDEESIDNVVSALPLARNDEKILDRHTYEPSRQDKGLSNTTREAILSNVILTTAEHNELRLKPLVLNCRKPSRDRLASRSHWILVEARLSDCTSRVYDSLFGRENMRKEANESLDSIITFLETRAEGPIERITGGIDRPTVPYRNWRRLIVKAAKAGDQP
ncbi:hypothetical protein MVLG_05012 [Microbotryum lychnidis-dioicae p1A1 Lamole]|uniref:Uncharacterized protein n=1 Tax=Microbotryum lychnidis-dioicae (strain p1A1 Lamole / MvSl-1064) TaxID=683840 RepID=U5HCY9_USTV1|nr:hypothetical protein MVLG_05012 [Microbotryum lychnidis-dioicae p1A1 Lamole]|eukprot:KDE04541.1 hypothetical protein MVLG_05012 [Microbotryum lychnidis-dioicae p1A1 Lamole]